MCALLKAVIRVLQSVHSHSRLPGYSVIRTCLLAGFITEYSQHYYHNTIDLRPQDYVNSALYIHDEPLVGMFYYNKVLLIVRSLFLHNSDMNEYK